MKGSNMRDKARAIFGKTFFENTKEPAPAKNGAVALQKRANARPIPTYKVGGVVKKQNGGALTPAEKARAQAMIKERGDAAMRDPLVMRYLDAQNRAPMGVPGVGPKAATKRAEGGGIESQRLKARVDAGNYKKGGKIAKKAVGGKAADRGTPVPAQKSKTATAQRPEPMPVSAKSDAMPRPEPMPVSAPKSDAMPRPEPMPVTRKPGDPNPPPKYPGQSGYYFEGPQTLTLKNSPQQLTLGNVPGSPPPRPIKKGGAVMKPVKRAVGGAGKTRKGQMKGC